MDNKNKQTLIENIVNREILQNVSSFINHENFFDMFSYSPYEIMENQMDYSLEAMQEFVQELSEEEIIDSLPDMDITLEEYRNDKLGFIETIANYHDFEPELNEPLEYWLISEWLYNKLCAFDECVMYIEDIDFYVWGRCTSGQVISIDSVMEKIALRLENK